MHDDHVVECVMRTKCVSSGESVLATHIINLYLAYNIATVNSTSNNKCCLKNLNEVKVRMNH